MKKAHTREAIERSGSPKKIRNRRSLTLAFRVKQNEAGVGAKEVALSPLGGAQDFKGKVLGKGQGPDNAGGAIKRGCREGVRWGRALGGVEGFLMVCLKGRRPAVSVPSTPGSPPSVGAKEGGGGLKPEEGTP